MTNLESAQLTAGEAGPAPDESVFAAPEAPDLPREIDGAGAFTRLIQASAARIGAMAEQFLYTDHPEATHQLRVALRRHRSLLKAFKPFLDQGFAQSQSARAQAMARRLGPLREADVMAAETLPALAAAAAEKGEGRAKTAAARAQGFSRLAERIAEEAARLRAELRASDLGLEACRLLLELQRAMASGAWRPRPAAAVCKAAGPVGAKGLDRKARRIAELALSRAARRLGKWGARVRTLDVEERHEMRKAAKSLRYAVEFFGPLFDPEQVKPYRRSLKRMQANFGALNDAADALKLRDLPAEPALIPAIEAAISASEARMAKEIPLAARSWRTLEQTATFWKEVR